MSGASGFGGVSLFELFRLEAESHCAALNAGLLALERTPNDRGVVEPLMRAAHSIKGAARIIGLHAVVSLAHAMEEVFLAAKEGKDSLGSARVDQLLQSVDVLAEIHALAEPDLNAWLSGNEARIAALAEALKSPPSANPSMSAAAPSRADPPPAVAAPPETPTAPATALSPESRPEQAPTARATDAGASGGASVRVSAQALSRMLFLAGASTVEASRFQSLRNRTSRLRDRERALEGALLALRETAAAEKHHGPRSGVALAALSAATDALRDAMVEQAAGLEDSLRSVEEISGSLYTEVIRSRMRPFAEGVAGFPRMVRDISRQLGKAVELRIEGESVEVDRDILQKLESPLTHMIRNSIDHGIEPESERLATGKPGRGVITLSAGHQRGMLTVEVRDDGRGIDPEAIRRKVVQRGLVEAGAAHRLSRAELMEFPFLPGFTTKASATEISGRGVGLDIVRTMVQEVGGVVALESEPGRGARFVMRLPVTRSVVRAALVRVGDQMFAAPLAKLDRIVVIAPGDMQTVQGRQQITIERRSIGLVQAADMLGAPSAPAGDAPQPALIFGADSSDSCGLIVDQVLGEEDLVVRPLDARLGIVAHIGAAAIRSDGSPVLIIDVDDLWRSVKRALQEGRPVGMAPQRATASQQSRRRVLVVDDSITVREVERQLLLRRGYAVEVAVDGKEGYNALRAGRFDLLITDVDMPRMTGIELIRAVRREARFAELPIIIVSYKDREEDRRMGLEAGASAYLTKSSFHDESLIRMVEDLIGAPA